MTETTAQWDGVPGDWPPGVEWLLVTASGPALALLGATYLTAMGVLALDTSRPIRRAWAVCLLGTLAAMALDAWMK